MTSTTALRSALGAPSALAVTGTLGAASYGRISSDPGNDKEGVTGQTERNLARIAAEPKWHFVGSYVDNDLSASKRGVRRPAFEMLLGDVRLGRVQIIVVYMSGRLLRNAHDRLRVRELFTEHRVVVVCTEGQDHDYSTASGRFVAGILGEVDEHETAQLRQRVIDEKKRCAEAGRSGGSRCYGYRPNPYAPKHKKERLIDPDEADTIKYVRDRVFKGASLRKICRELDEQGRKPLYAEYWSPPSLRGMITNPSIAGKRVHHGEVIGDADWEPIIKYEEHLRIVQMLGRRATPNSWSTRIVHLLSGIALCGTCATGKCNCKANVDGKGHRVTVIGQGESIVKGNVYPPHYRCQSPPRGCNGLRRPATFVEQFVEDTVLAMVADPRFVAAILVSGAPDVEQALEVQRKIDACRDRAISIGIDIAGTEPGSVTRIALDAALFKLEGELDALHSEQARMRRTTGITRIAELGDIVGRWPQLGLPAQREIISEAVEVTLMPAGHGVRTGTNHIRIVGKVALA